MSRRNARQYRGTPHGYKSNLRIIEKTHSLEYDTAVIYDASN